MPNIIIAMLCSSKMNHGISKQNSSSSITSGQPKKEKGPEVAFSDDVEELRNSSMDGQSAAGDKLMFNNGMTQVMPEDNTMESSFFLPARVDSPYQGRQFEHKHNMIRHHSDVASLSARPHSTPCTY